MFQTFPDIQGIKTLAQKWTRYPCCTRQLNLNKLAQAHTPNFIFKIVFKFFSISLNAEKNNDLEANITETARLFGSSGENMEQFLLQLNAIYETVSMRLEQWH